MHALVKGLPRDALVRTPVAERGRDPWTAELELMAQLVEVVSIQVAGMRLRKPIKVPRPKKDTAAKAAAQRAGRPVAVDAGDNPYRSAIRSFAAHQPSRLRGEADAAPDPGPAARAGADPSFRAARQVFGRSQPSRLRLVDDQEAGSA